MSYCHRSSGANKRNLAWAEGLPTVINVCFAYCSLIRQELLPQLLLQAPGVLMPKILAEARGLQQLQGISAWGCELAARPNSSRVTSSMAFSLSSVLCNFSSFLSPIIFSLPSPNPLLPFLSPKKAPLTNTFQEKLQQNEQDKACPQLPSSPLPAEAAHRSLWEDDSS